MKKIIFLGLFMLFAVGNINAQAKGKPKASSALTLLSVNFTKKVNWKG